MYIYIYTHYIEYFIDWVQLRQVSLADMGPCAPTSQPGRMNLGFVT